MDDKYRETYINDLDNELLKGGVSLSEWCTFIVRDADTAFIAGAYLATIITSMAGIETHLRSENADYERMSFFDLIEASPISLSLKLDIHILRKYRNQWVHIACPQNDYDILEQPTKYENALKENAIKSIRVLRETIYKNQWV